MSHPANKYRPVVLFAGPTTAFLHILYLAMPVIPCLHNAICKLIMMRLENQLLIATLFTVAPSAVFTLAIIDQCNEECTPNVSSSLHTVYVNKDDACYFTCDYYQFFSQASLSRSICVKIWTWWKLLNSLKDSSLFVSGCGGAESICEECQQKI